MTHYEWLASAVLIDSSNECLLWPFKKDRDGYGRLKYEKKQVGAHRLAFKLIHGRWPEPNALHTCDNPPCVNPRHLWEGSNADNQADKVAKGRQLFGVMQHDAKLTDSGVIAAREEYGKGRVGFNRLAQKYGVSKIAMRWAIEGKTWAHLPGAVPAFQFKRQEEFCKRGHQLSEDTCYIYGRSRQCKACMHIRYEQAKKPVQSVLPHGYLNKTTGKDTNSA